MGTLDGKVALVTGAASGIGLATARRLAADGATVVGTDIQECDGWDLKNPVVEHDVTDEPRTKTIVDDVVAAHGTVDIVVSAAGVAGGGPVHLLELAEWQRVQDINLTGTFLTCKYAVQPMLAQRSGSIITIASIEGLGGAEGGTTYNASKGGVVLLTKSMALDYGRMGIRVNAICPGFIETPLASQVFEFMGDDLKKSIREQHQLGRFGQPSEIASAASFLASDDASFITGVALPVDGGYIAGARHGFAAMMGLE